MRSSNSSRAKAAGLVLFAALLLTTGCTQRVVKVDHPFYVMYAEDPDERALFRCPDGPNGGCAVDGLPGPTVFAAGANRTYVTVARHPRVGDVPGFRQTDLERTEYFYFARVSNETRGWGDNPERIIGPLTQKEFDDARQRLHLPEFSVKLR